MKKALSLIVFLIPIIFFPSGIKAQAINEFVPDSVQEWIELYNASDSADYLKTYYIDDDTDFVSDSGSSAKKLLTNLNISNPRFPTIDTSSFLNNSGDWVVLFDQAGTLIDKYEFSSNPGKDVSIGRYPDSTGSFSVLAYFTKADANASPPTPAPTPTPNPTSTPTQAPAPTSSPTRSPSPTPSKTPTPTATTEPTDVLNATQEAILGTSDSQTYSEPTNSPTTDGVVKTKAPVLAISLITLGLGFVGLSAFLAFRRKTVD